MVVWLGSVYVGHRNCAPLHATMPALVARLLTPRGMTSWIRAGCEQPHCLRVGSTHHHTCRLGPSACLNMAIMYAAYRRGPRDLQTLVGLPFLMPRRPRAPMHMIRSSIFLVLAAVAVAAYAAPAAHADHPTASVSNAKGSSVPGCEATNECFIPADVTVDVGGEVTWSNDDTAAHTITSGTPADGPDGTFDSSLVMPGTTFSYTFEDAGEYTYFCVVHPWMEGTVTVSGEAHGGDDMTMDDSAMSMGSDDDDHGAMDDDHGHEHDAEEAGAMPEGDVSATGMLPDGTAVELTATQLLEQRVMQIDVVFKDSEHVNYDIVAVQDGKTVLEDMGAHEHMGVGSHRTMPLDLDPEQFPLDITVTFSGYGISEMTGEPGEVVFASIVPEFGAVAALVLAVAIVSIIAVTARSRLGLVPRV